MAVGSALRVEIVIIAPFFLENQMQDGRYAYNEQVERSEQFGIHGVAVHLVADSVCVVRIFGMEEGETAQRDAAGVLREALSGKTKTIVPVVHKGQPAQKRHHEQCHQILRQLP